MDSMDHDPQFGSGDPPETPPGHESEEPPGYPPQAEPGYPAQAPPGYPPQAPPGYPAQAEPAYSPQAPPGYPPQAPPGYPAQAPPGYPPPPRPPGWYHSGNDGWPPTGPPGSGHGDEWNLPGAYPRTAWPPAPPVEPRNQWLRVVAVGALIVVVAVVSVLAGRASNSSSVLSPSNLGSGGTGSSSPTSGAPATPGVAAKVDPGIVDVNTQLSLGSGSAAGTGMVISSSGDVLTNNHVVEGATSVSVTDLGNGHTYRATVVGTDKTNDIALLRLIGASGLATVKVGDSSKITQGEAVTAIGNAGGTGGAPSVTTGNVTALNQTITASDEVDGSAEQLSGLVQTNASLQPGDSGGPLVDNSARVVAIDTAASAGFQFQSGSASYAIPINQAISIASQIEAGRGSPTIHIGPNALLGVVVQGSDFVAGAQVNYVESGSPASQAGIITGDVITSLGGQNVSSPTTLSNLMYTHHPGDSVKVGWVDSSGQQHSATVRLATGPAA